MFVWNCCQGFLDPRGREGNFFLFKLESLTITKNWQKYLNLHINKIKFHKQETLCLSKSIKIQVYIPALL